MKLIVVLFVLAFIACINTIKADDFFPCKSNQIKEVDLFLLLDKSNSIGDLEETVSCFHGTFFFVFFFLTQKT